MQELHEFTIRLLLRYFRAARDAAISHADVDRFDDLNILRWHWSVSRPVLDLCDYVIRNRHEVQSSLGERLRADDAIVRGRIDARRTILARELSGYPTRVIFAEPVKSYTSGPNHVLVWVLQRAHLLLARFAEEAGPSSGYTQKVAAAVKAVSAARRISSVAQAIAESDYTQRPSPQSLMQAAGARKQLYRLAHAAYLFLRRIEDGDPAAIADLLGDTLLAPLYEWQAFELALALGMGAAIAARDGGMLRLRSISPGSAAAIIQAGGYVLHWQSKTQAYRDPCPEPSERMVTDILQAYGVQVGDDRPDIVVTDSRGQVVAIGEAKFFTNETEGWRSGFRAAALQLVRYGRGYASEVELEQLLCRSLIGLWHYPSESRPATLPAAAPAVVDFRDLVDRRLAAWAARVVPALPVIQSAA